MKTPREEERVPDRFKQWWGKSGRLDTGWDPDPADTGVLTMTPHAHQRENSEETDCEMKEKAQEPAEKRRKRQWNPPRVTHAKVTLWSNHVQLTVVGPKEPLLNWALFEGKLGQDFLLCDFQCEQMPCDLTLVSEGKQKVLYKDEDLK